MSRSNGSPEERKVHQSGGNQQRSEYGCMKMCVCVSVCVDMCPGRTLTMAVSMIWHKLARKGTVETGPLAAAAVSPSLSGL